MKRFTDTCKWDDPWFRALSGVQKLIFLYVIDRCNNAGFWERDDDSLAFHTKLKPELINAAWQGLSRALVESGGWVWVRRFLRHQKNESLSAINPAHKQIIALLSEQRERFAAVPEFSPFIAPYLGLLSHIGIGIGKGIEKEEGDARGRDSRHRFNATELLQTLNRATGKNFTPAESHLKPIIERLSEKGIEPEECEKMILRQVKLWKDDPKMAGHLVPSTLFRPSNFQKYYDQRNDAIGAGTAPSQFDTQGGKRLMQ